MGADADKEARAAVAPELTADRALQRDVRLLGVLLGDVIIDERGRGLLQLVEEIRAQTREMRRCGNTAHPRRLMARLERLDLRQQEGVARAFCLYFLLANTAEQIHRLRRRAAYRRARRPQPGGLDAWTHRAKAAGLSASSVKDALDDAVVDIVFTAHPTEVRRRTVLALQRRLASDLRLLRVSGTSATERSVTTARLKETVRGLWQTRMVRMHAPTVLDEVEQGIEYLVPSVAPAIPSLAEAWQAALRQLGIRDRPRLPLRTGSWIGGDRDGHPGVTADLTRYALERMDRAGREMFARRVGDLLPQLAWRRDELGPAIMETLGLRAESDSDEPLRAFAEATQHRLGLRRHAGDYPSDEAFLEDLNRRAARTAPWADESYPTSSV